MVSRYTKKEKKNIAKDDGLGVRRPNSNCMCKVHLHFRGGLRMQQNRVPRLLTSVSVLGTRLRMHMHTQLEQVIYRLQLMCCE